MTQSLMTALDQARTLLEQGADVPTAERGSLTDTICAGYHRDPAQVSELYIEAGMHPPDRSATAVVAPLPWAPHAKRLPERIVAALHDKTQWSAASLSAALGISKSHLGVAIHRLRSQGCPIETHRGKSIVWEQL